MESLEKTLTIDPIMGAQAVESRRLSRLARDRLGEYASEGHGRIGANTDDWLSPLNTTAAVLGDQVAPFGMSDTSLGSSKEEVSATEYRQPFAEVLDHPLVNKFLHGHREYCAILESSTALSMQRILSSSTSRGQLIRRCTIKRSTTVPVQLWVVGGNKQRYGSLKQPLGTIVINGNSM